MERTMREIELEEMLEARDRRIRRQEEILKKYHTTLICFTMNIAGPIKYSERIRLGFSAGQAALKRALAAEKIEILTERVSREATGCEGFYAVACAPESAKKLTTEIEDGSPLGRLFDMDVLRPDGRKVERTELGLPVRTCLICGKPARECARSRAHSVPELQAKTRSILEQSIEDLRASKAAELAVRSLLYEVGTTPKPGLVDRNNNGSHRDMDVFTFFNSAAALGPYYETCARIGFETRDESPAATFERIRPAGRNAERLMYAATKGVNTHKGAIFTLGLVTASLGRLPADTWADAGRVLSEAGRMAQESLKDFERGNDAETELDAYGQRVPRTSGEKFYKAYGVTGVRGQAAAGFPAVREYGLPVLKEGLSRGLSMNDAGAAALLHILANTTDTNMISRSSRSMQEKVSADLRALLSKTAFPAIRDIEALDQQFIRANLSPGGSADLLALCFYFVFLSDPHELEGLI